MFKAVPCRASDGQVKKYRFDLRSSLKSFSLFKSLKLQSSSLQFSVFAELSLCYPEIRIKKNPAPIPTKQRIFSLQNDTTILSAVDSGEEVRSMRRMFWNCLVAMTSGQFIIWRPARGTNSTQYAVKQQNREQLLLSLTDVRRVCGVMWSNETHDAVWSNESCLFFSPSWEPKQFRLPTETARHKGRMSRMLAKLFQSFYFGWLSLQMESWWAWWWWGWGLWCVFMFGSLSILAKETISKILTLIIFHKLLALGYGFVLDTVLNS